MKTSPNLYLIDDKLCIIFIGLDKLMMHVLNPNPASKQ